MKILVQSFQALSDLLFPRCCLVCNGPLSEKEEYICIGCNIQIPRTDYHQEKDNPVEKLFWGRINIERGTSFFRYAKGSDYNSLLFHLKYKGYKELARFAGRLTAAEIQDSGFFIGMDYIIPVPLHRKKQRIRGYNQSEYFAKGISQVTGIPVQKSNLVRTEERGTQTRKSVLERWENVDGIFCVKYPELLTGKHILLVDDVLTTGSTLVSCASALNQAGNTSISILTLAIAL